jgi:molybdenum cofactor cytidylyltransferase/nicotine blue oxidoreductase
LSVAVAVLAAGRGSRFGGDEAKPLARLQGRPLVAWALDAALQSGLRPVWLVTGNAGRAVAAAAPPGVDIAHNRRWRKGIATSLRAAIEALDPYTGVDAVCVGLADQPRVGPDAYRRLAAAHADGAQLAVATYDGVRGNPVLLARSLWAEARKLEGDVGARQLMHDHDVVEVPCDGTGSAVDVDTAEDLRQLNEQRSEEPT